jgi:hypothetical protein
MNDTCNFCGDELETPCAYPICRTCLLQHFVDSIVNTKEFRIQKRNRGREYF